MLAACCRQCFPFFFQQIVASRPADLTLKGTLQAWNVLCTFSFGESQVAADYEAYQLWDQRKEVGARKGRKLLSD